MYIIVPIVFLAIIVWAIWLVVAAGTIVLSPDHVIKPLKPLTPHEPLPKIEPNKAEKKQTETQKPYIELPNGQLIELQPNEVAKAKKDKFKVIYK